MSEEIQTNNTISRKRASASMVEWERLTVKDGGNICIVTEKDLKEMDEKIANVQTLENQIRELQQQLIQANEAKETAQNDAERVRKNMAVVERENLAFDKQVKELESEKRRLEESYKAVNLEYSKLKVFKENAGRGRQNVLSPEQVGLIRTQALEGWSVVQSHESLLDMGVNVSYETVRKVVADMNQQKMPPKVKRDSFLTDLDDEFIVVEEIIDVPMPVTAQNAPQGAQIPSMPESSLFGQKSNVGNSDASKTIMDTEKHLDRFNMSRISSDPFTRD